MNTWRSQLRFVLPLIVLLVCVAELALPLIDRATVRWFTRDLTLRGDVIATSLADSIEAALRLGDTQKLQLLVDRLSHDERLFAVALCGLDDHVLVRTAGLPATLGCAQARAMLGSAAPPLRIEGGAMAISVHAVPGPDGPLATLVLLHDLGFVENRSKATQRYLVALLVGLGLLTAAITLAVAQWSWRNGAGGGGSTARAPCCAARNSTRRRCR